MSQLLAPPATVPTEEVLAEGRKRLDDLGIDLTALATAALANYARVADFSSTNALHYYGKLGYDEAAASSLHELIKRYVALAAAWKSLGLPGYLSLPERVDSDGWHGFIIQTRDYQALSDRLGQFVHHATTEAPQDDAVTVTFAAMAAVYGLLSPDLWEDCPGCIIYGWCSSSSGPTAT